MDGHVLDGMKKNIIVANNAESDGLDRFAVDEHKCEVSGQVVFLMGDMSLTPTRCCWQLWVMRQRQRAELELLGTGHGCHQVQVPQADQEGHHRLRHGRREPIHAH
jgi:hypothetical protein